MKVLLALCLMFLAVSLPLTGFAQSTRITYQGQLSVSGAQQANYQMRFRLYGTLVGGSPIGNPIENPAVAANGNVVTDARGEATIELPEWFEALNRDFRYQLTVIGQFAQAIVSEKINSNRFRILTDLPGVEVSWQVTGIRQDAWAEAHRIQVEEYKPATERGHYLHPELFGKSEEFRIDVEKFSYE